MEKRYLVIEHMHLPYGSHYPDKIIGIWKFTSLIDAQEMLHKLHEAAVKKFDPDEDSVGRFFMSMGYTTGGLIWSCKLSECGPEKQNKHTS